MVTEITYLTGSP